jgi:hypothetical protein
MYDCQLRSEGGCNPAKKAQATFMDMTRERGMVKDLELDEVLLILCGTPVLRILIKPPAY